MKEKCSKFEALFTFADEEQLKAHIAECDECRNEYEMMNKVSALIQEVKPHYMQHKTFATRLKAACILLAFIVSGATFSILGTNPDVMDTLRYGTTLSAEDLGLPVDSYGLIVVE